MSGQYFKNHTIKLAKHMYLLQYGFVYTFCLKIMHVFTSSCVHCLLLVVLTARRAIRESFGLFVVALAFPINRRYACRPRQRYLTLSWREIRGDDDYYTRSPRDGKSFSTNWMGLVIVVVGQLIQSYVDSRAIASG